MRNGARALNVVEKSVDVIAIEPIRSGDIYRGLMFHYYKRYKTELVDFHRGIHYASLIDSSITAN